MNRPVLEEVNQERSRQEGKWGGNKHDDKKSTEDFAQLIQDYAGWARVMSGMNSPDKARRRLVNIAALAVAAVESMDRRGITSPPIVEEPSMLPIEIIGG